MSDEKQKSKTYEEFASFIKSDLSKKINAKLTEVSSLADLNSILSDVISPFYDSNESIHKRLGSILNSIFTQRTTVFSLTYRLNGSLVRNDPNHTLKSCDSKDHKEVMNLAFNSGLFTILRKPVCKGYGIKGKAGLYELSHEKFLKPLKEVIGSDICDMKKQKFVDWWDNSVELSDSNHLSILPSMEKTEEELRVERIVREHRARKQNRRI